MPASTRWGIPYPAGTDLVDVPGDMQGIADSLDNHAKDLTQGTLVSRPAASAAGRYYYATDEKVVYRDNGTTWEPCLPASPLGINTDGVIRRGKSIIATEESRSNTAYGLLTTPDRVQNVALPTDGFICIVYRAEWKDSSASGACGAAIFLGSNQLKMRYGSAFTPTIQVQEAQHAVPSNFFTWLSTSAIGLTSYSAPVSLNAPADPGTGLLIGQQNSGLTGQGGCMFVEAAAGTYDVSVQFRAGAAGSVTVKNRKLWVWTMGF